jgi:hypothetical protein
MLLEVWPISDASSFFSQQFQLQAWLAPVALDLDHSLTYGTSDGLFVMVNS